jgi:CO/xanthine dehydrogenase Mo-binding subunit
LKESPGFISDFSVPGMLSGVTIRSPVSKVALRSIECPKLNSSYILIRSSDIPGKNELAGMSVPVLASGALSYYGEPVALLIGPNTAKLEEYAAQCRVIADEEEPNYSGIFIGEGSDLAGGSFARRNIRIGDPETAFAEAKTVITGTYRAGIQEHWYSEPTGAAAIFSGEQTIIHTVSQWPFHVRSSAALVLKLDLAKIVVESSRAGKHLDGKIWYPSLLACQAALGSFISGKPVKIMLSREEDFRFSPKRFGAQIRIASALDEEGRISASEIDASAELGAQGIFTDEILDRLCLGALGSYKQKNALIRGAAIKTNIPPGGPFAGFGMAQGFFAMERHMSRIADSLRQEPSEWRKNNFFNREKSLAIGAPVKESTSLEELLDTAEAMSDYRRKWASYELLRGERWRSEGTWDHKEVLRGIGIACAYQGSGLMYPPPGDKSPGVEVTLDKEGSLSIKTSMVPSNDEILGIWRNTAAEILAVESDAVRIGFAPAEGEPETSAGTAGRGSPPDSGPDCLSRNVTVLTKLIERCCQAIRKQRFRDPLPITVRRSYTPAKARTWGGKEPTGSVFDTAVFSRLSWAAAVVEVEIEPMNYTPKIRGAWLGVEGGRIFSEARARRSLKQGIIQALGWASREELNYVDGQIPIRYIYDYDIPPPSGIPPIQIDFIWNDSVNPKGIGELPFSCIPAAYLQAVSQAMDHHFEAIPLRSLAIWNVGKLKTQQWKDQQSFQPETPV